MNKNFDCVEMKHRGAEQILKKLSGLSPEEELEFWKKRTKALQRLQQKVSAKNEPSKANSSKSAN